MQTFRKIIFWLHLVAGVVGGIVIFVMCVTGAMLSFERNIIESAESGMRYVALSENGQRLSAEEILRKVLEAKPDAKPTSMTLRNEPNAAWQVSLGRGKQIFANPFTGEMTGEGATDFHAFFGFAMDLHRWIALSGDGRPIGRAITGACNLMFLLLAISGIYIWFPRRLNWKSVRAAMTFRWKIKGKARDFNWHTVFGFWLSLILIVLTLTATVISYQWARNLVYTLTGNEVPPQQQSSNQTEEKPFVLPENVNVIWAKAENHAANWKSMTLRFPFAKDAAVFSIDEGIYLNKFGRSSLTIDVKTREVVKWETYADQNAARKTLNWFRFTHTGESFGFIGQLIGFLACLGGAVLVWTGISLSVRRFWRWRLKRTVV